MHQRMPIPALLVLVLLLCVSPMRAAEHREEGTGSSKSGQEDAAQGARPTPQYTEEVDVVAQAPDEVLTVSTPSIFVIERETIEKVADYNLSKPFLYTTGAYVSTGTKNESSLQIRGLSSGKIALLYDGIPVYEPYFGSFDLHAVTAEEVESIKILKGTASVLYGPNVLGGAVNVLTRRPEGNGASAVASCGSFGDTGLAATGTARSGRFAFLGSVSYHSVDDFEYKGDGGESVTRANSDDDTKSFTGKVYYYPGGGKSEILAEAGYVTSEYGIPWATEVYRPRYWRFSDWDRYLFQLGGTVPFAGQGYLKARGYYVKHHNVLDAYTDETLSELDWVSTFNNYSYGGALLGSVGLGARNELRFSAHAKSDHARTQGDIGEPWERVSQETFSVGAEDHFRLRERWVLMAGASVDMLNKEAGNNKTALNPIVGMRYAPRDSFTLSATFSRKSRFPTMKDLYSSTAGNPDLREERSTNAEVGFAYEKGVAVTGAVFRDSIRDLIQSIRTEEGWHIPFNVGRARITGVEIGVRKDLERATLSANYTWLDSEDLDADLPLSLVPQSQLNLALDLEPRPDWRLSFWGTGALNIETNYDGEALTVPDYFTANAGVAKTFRDVEISARVENLADAAYVTEPGFPMPGRTFRLALRLRLDRS